MSSGKFDICQIFRSEMSADNSKCLAEDWRFAGQNVRQGLNKFRVLCGNDWQEYMFIGKHVLRFELLTWAWNQQENT